MAVIIEFSIIPLGTGTSVSKLLAPAIRELEKKNIKYVMTPMCTIIEAESLEKGLKCVEEAHEAVFEAGAKRAVTVIKIDDRRDVDRSMKDKLESLEKAIKDLEK